MSMSVEKQQALEFTLGDYMKKSMKAARYSVYDMADYLGVARETVSTWLNDRIVPSKQTLMLWALRTEVDVEWLESRLSESNRRPSHYE